MIQLGCDQSTTDQSIKAAADMRFTLTTKEAATELRTSESTLRRLRKEGVLKPGVHFIAVGAGAVAPNMLWSASEVQETLAKRTRRLMAAPATRVHQSPVALEPSGAAG